jgi:molybdate transport system substrate-binding protein
MRYGTSTSLVEAISKGERFDVAVLTSGGIDDSIKSGKLVRESRTNIARAGIGVGVRAGAAKPDIATADALKQTLLKAKSLTYAEDGASSVYLEKMFTGLGIDKALKPKIVLTQGSVKAGERVASGSVEMILTLVSEILPMPGVDFVGPLPAPLQSYVSFAAAVSTNASSADAGRALIKFLTGPEAMPAFKPKGMEPLQTKIR